MTCTGVAGAAGMAWVVGAATGASHPTRYILMLSVIEGIFRGRFGPGRLAGVLSVSAAVLLKCRSAHDCAFRWSLYSAPEFVLQTAVAINITDGQSMRTHADAAGF